mgnify:CR=1 FL=1
MVENPTVLAVLDDMLEANYLLSAGLSIDLHPGESPQAVHFDDSFYPVPRPRPPIGMSVIWAIDDFTLENGATQLIPGSHTWGDENPDGLPAEHEIALPRHPVASRRRQPISCQSSGRHLAILRALGPAAGKHDAGRTA